MKNSIEIKKEYSTRFENVGINLTSVRKSNTEGFDYKVNYRKNNSEREETHFFVDENHLESWLCTLEEEKNFNS